MNGPHYQLQPYCSACDRAMSCIADKGTPVFASCPNTGCSEWGKTYEIPRVSAHGVPASHARELPVALAAAPQHAPLVSGSIAWTQTTTGCVSPPRVDGATHRAIS